jgi:hypothetical protein
VIIPVGYSQVNLKYTGSNIVGTAECTFGVTNTTPDAPSTVEAAVFTAWDAHLKGLFTNDITLASILVKNGPNATGAFVDVSHGTVPSGTGLVVPGQVSALMRKVTALGGRKGRGRLYHPGVFTGMLNADQSSIASATITAMSGGYNDFLTALNVAGYPIVLLHGDSTTPTIVSSFVCESQVATQRRRVRR